MGIELEAFCSSLLVRGKKDLNFIPVTLFKDIVTFCFFLCTVVSYLNALVFVKITECDTKIEQ